MVLSDDFMGRNGMWRFSLELCHARRVPTGIGAGLIWTVRRSNLLMAC
jgi:hypothetical protein